MNLSLFKTYTDCADSLTQSSICNGFMHYVPAVPQLSLCWALLLSCAVETPRPERLFRLVSDRAAYRQNTATNIQAVFSTQKSGGALSRGTDRLIWACFETWCNLWSSLLMTSEFSRRAGPLSSTGLAAAGTPLEKKTTKKPDRNIFNSSFLLAQKIRQ